ncbi:MAG TPA: prepilin-type N-terminal cleavage/methylation domain-containing protein [Usitatibacteraceae bacterium]|nr:prepilin-type N-terminal cleavage/methylation domain-containing protein [Usitatibacteraceae bacterium]
MRTRQAGFTLMELVIVIVIIGILAAVALPRFVNMQRDARTAKAQGIYGAVKSAAVLAKSRCELDLSRLVAGGTCTATGGTVNMDGAVVSMVNRYPAATASGIDRAAQVSPAEGVTIGGSGSQRIYEVAGAGLAVECRIVYNEAPLGGAPDIQIVTSGC